jgi:glycolate oxidase FAD binding subunit
LAEAGQLLAFEPPRFNGAGTIGGAIAAGLSGPRRAYAGAARDFILGTRVIDGKGNDLAFGGRVIKNVAGFDVSRLMAGALGTLGVITEISLKTLPRPPAEATLRFTLSEADAIRRMNQWAGKPLPLSATCFRAGVLTVRLSGAESALKAAIGKLGGEMLADETAFWDGLRDQTDGFFAAPTLWRVSLPATSPPLDIGVPQLIEWGGGLRWLAGQVDAVALRDKVTALGGHATLFRAADKSAGVFQPLAPGMAALHQRLKRSLDPGNIFNRGRMYEFECI